MTRIDVHIRTRAEKLWRVVYDDECIDWSFNSRTIDPEFMMQHNLSQAPAVYPYSRYPEYEPTDYRVNETGMEADYLRINNYDGQGQGRCNYLFGSGSALYNSQDPDGVGFPKRDYLTMSGNVLREIEWLELNGRRYLKFETVKPMDDLSGLTFEKNPDKVHRFHIVQYRDAHTLTVPVINRGGYVYYFLSSAEGFAYYPERFVKAV